MENIQNTEINSKEVIIEEITTMLQDLTVEELSIIIEATNIMDEHIEYSSNKELFEMATTRYKNKVVA